MKRPDTEQRYYKEVLKNMHEILILLKENNMMIRDIATVMQENHKITLALAIALGKVNSLPSNRPRRR